MPPSACGRPVARPDRAATADEPLTRRTTAISPESAETTETDRRRPRDRKQTIVREAGRLFARHGSVNVTMAQIADAVGITAGGLYRHFAGKSELLAHVLATWFDTINPSADRDLPLAEILRRRAENSVELPTLGLLWSRESRHLPAELYEPLLERIRSHHRIYDAAIRRERPDIEPQDAATLAWAIQSVLASTISRIRGLRDEDYADTLTRAALAVTQVDLPHAEPRPAVSRWTGRPQSKRENLLTIAEQLFAERGFENTTLTDIGAVAGVSGPSLYSHFEGKGDILTELLVRGNSTMWVGLHVALHTGDDPMDALLRLVRSYVQIAQDRPSLVAVVVAQANALLPEQRRGQLEYIAEWVALLTEARPGLPAPEAHALVRAALRSINDLARTRRITETPGFLERVTLIAMAILLA